MSLRKKVLVTGGTGYLGARIGGSLAAYGYSVFLGSRRPFSHGDVERCNQILTNWDDPDLTFCKGYDYIIHAAGMNAYECEKNPKSAKKFNGEITELLVKKAAAYGCKRFFYLSTVHVYKSPLSGCFDEKSPSLNTHPYATSHLFGEEALIRISESSSMKGHVLRLSNCFGYPLTQNNDCWGLVLNQFVREACNLGKITIRGDYLARRDFLPIKQFTSVLERFLEITTPIPQVINISSGTSLTLLEAAEIVSSLITKMTGRHVRVVKGNTSGINYELKIKNSSLCEMGITISNNLVEEIKLLVDFLRNYEIA